VSAPLVVNTTDGTVWLRRAATRGGLALYAPEGVCSCPEFVMATEAELAEHGISGSADVLPVPVGPEPQAPMSLKAALIRLAQYGERTSTWSTATYDSGAEKALHEIAVTLDAALKSERERYKAGLLSADEQVNAMSEELKRYAAGTETPVLWSVYNAMHLRAVNAETELEQLRTQVAELEAAGRRIERLCAEAAEALRANRDRIAEQDAQLEAARTEYAVQYPDGQTVMADTVTRIRARAEASLRAHLEIDSRLWAGCRIVQRFVSHGEWVESSADRVTRLLAPTQALRDEDPNHLRHTYRLSRDLPPFGGAPC
jgi:hypothetical protein